jgi:S-DNA-T family DNA segregation ATPase FtsK/SpoIIIE
MNEKKNINNNIDDIYNKIYEESYGIKKQKIETKFTYKYLKYLFYIYYIYFYLLLYIHNLKFKIINTSKIPLKIYNIDYLFLYILVGLGPIGIYYIYEKYYKNYFTKKLLFGFQMGLFIFLIIYGFLNESFIHKSFYFYENIFICYFQLSGVLLIFLFYNQLIFLLGFLFLYLLKLIFPSKSYLIFGRWGGLPNKYFLFFMFLILMNILSTILLDVFFSDEEVLTSNYNKNNNMDNRNIDFQEIPIKENIFDNFPEINRNDNVQKNTEKKILYNKKENIINQIYFNSEKNQKEEEDLTENILKVLKNFSIDGEVFHKINSLTVTNYFFKPKSGTKTSRIESIEEEISMDLNRSTRIATNIKGIIFEVSNENVQSFTFKDVWNKINQEEINNKYILPLFLGFDTLNENIIIDLTQQPHLLISGTTGSGKSSTIHTIIHSLVLKNTPEKVQFVLIDPKILELSIYNNIPYLWNPIITTIEDGVEILEKLVTEMEVRYKTMSKANKRSIIEYNKTYKPLPYIVFIIEEFADFALYKNNNFSSLVQKLAQMGRAAGIHGIIATQRPSANVINGVIKANFPSRIALKVTNKLESRIILDNSGAEKLSNPGEMILMNSSGFLKRGICPYISEEEILNLINFLKNN